MLKLFQKKRVIDLYEVIKQVNNIENKGYETNSEKFWTLTRLKQEMAKQIEVIR